MSLSRDIAESYVALSKQGYDASVVAQAVASFINENNLFSLKEKIIDQVKALEDADNLYKTTHISSAHHLSESMKHKIARAVSKTDGALVSVVHAPELIAGYVARYKGVLWDASLKGSLERLRENLKR